MGDNLKRSIYALRAKTPFEKSLLKATYDGDSDPPKEKHVQTILWTLQGQNMQTPPEAAFNNICQRLMTSRWATALKAEIILHRGIEQVGPGYASRLADVNIPMQNFNDPCERGSAHNRIIQDYFAYIRSCANNHSRRNSALLIPPADRAKLFNHLDDPELMKEIGFLLTQLQHLVKLGPSCHQAIRNYHLKLTQNAAFIVLKDASGLYKTISIAVEIMLDRFFAMERTLAEHAVEQYKRFETCTRMLSQFFEIASYLPYSGLVPPTYVQKPPEVIVSMTSYIQESQGSQTVAKEEVPSDLHISKEELEMQRKVLEEYEKEHKKRQVESASRELISEPETRPAPSNPPPQPQSKPAPSSSSNIDLLLGAFDNPAPVTSAPNPTQAQTAPPQGMNPMITGMNPAMMAMMTGMIPNMGGIPPNMATGMPGMMPPGMGTGMMPPGMGTGMMPPGMGMGGIPMMTGMPGMMPSMMTGMPGMMNPMFQAYMTQQLQAKSNLDPNSKPVGQLGDPGKQGQFGNPPSRTTASLDPFGNPVPQARGSNPFESSTSSNPFDMQGGSQSRGGDMWNTGKPAGSADPFRDLI
jgi:hypothetical protein